MKKVIIFIFSLSLFFILNINTNALSPWHCEDVYWKWSIEIWNSCWCKAWYIKWIVWVDSPLCKLNKNQCTTLYWINAEMKTTWICWCKNWYYLYNWSCLFNNSVCIKKHWINSKYYWIDSCACKDWYKFWNLLLKNIKINDNSSIQCIQGNNSSENITNIPNNSENINNIGILPEKEIESAKFLAKNGIINNQNNEKDYNVSNLISRREMLKIIMKLSWKNVWWSCEWKFKDLWKNDWWCVYAESALSFWFISNNWNFRPNENVSKIEAIKMIFQSKWISVEKTTDWRVWYVNKWVEEKLFDNFTDYNNSAKRWFIFNIASDIISNENLFDMFDDLSDDNTSNQTISCWKNSSPSSAWNCSCNEWYVWEDKNDENNLDCVEEENLDDVFNGLFDE